MQSIPQNAVAYKVRVRYFETDQMQVAHHAHYLVWFEAARSEFCRAKGIDYGQVEKEGLFLPIVEARCRYKRPAEYDNELVIYVWVSSVKRSILRLKYVVMRDDIEIAEGETTQILIDRAGKTVQFPPDIADKFGYQEMDE